MLQLQFCGLIIVKNAHFYADCADRYFSGPTGQISSPNFPLAYSNNRDCSNFITILTGQIIVITFFSFNVETGNDWLQVCIRVSNVNIWFWIFSCELSQIYSLHKGLERSAL